MAFYIFNDTRTVDVGSAFALASLDQLILGASGFWSSLDGVGIAMSFANRVTIHGQVYGSTALYATDMGNIVTIGATGIVSGIANAISAFGDNASVDLTNAGFISSQFGALLGRATNCTNSGTIQGDTRAIQVANRIEFTLVNTGLIASERLGIDLFGTGSFGITNDGRIVSAGGEAVHAAATSAGGRLVNRGEITGAVALETTSAVTVVNSGTIDGAVTLSAWDDVFDSTGGHLSGVVALGAGDDLFFGSVDGDVVLGGEGEDELSGGAGDDRLAGGAGADLLDGGIGFDIASYEAATASGVIADLVGGGLSGDATYDRYVAVEGLSGSRYADRLLGDAKANRLWGNDGDDTLDGRGGADLMRGGAGNDAYTVDHAGDRVVERAGAGLDTVLSSVTFVLPDHVEVLTLTGRAAVDGVGNALNNLITGNSAANNLYGGDGGDTLNGGAGADTMTGAGGSDTFVVDNAGDVVIEYAGGGDADLVQASVSYVLAETIESLALTGTRAIDGTGSAGDNSISGNDAANVLNGGGGSDYLYGGGGIDRFVFGAGQQHVSIGDFTPKVDKLQLSRAVFAAIEGNGTLSADQFHLGSAAADAEADHLRPRHDVLRPGRHRAAGADRDRHLPQPARCAADHRERYPAGRLIRRRGP